MEEKIESTDFLQRLNEEFNVISHDYHQYSPLTLAFIGDGVYDLLVRTLLVEQANAPVKSLHKHASQIVCAKAQAALAQAISDELTPEEHAIFKRGRNAKPSSTAKNAARMDYLNATGLETLFGFLYLSNRMDRAIHLLKLGFDRQETEL